MLYQTYSVICVDKIKMSYKNKAWIEISEFRYENI